WQFSRLLDTWNHEASGSPWGNSAPDDGEMVGLSATKGASNLGTYQEERTEINCAFHGWGWRTYHRNIALLHGLSDAGSNFMPLVCELRQFHGVNVVEDNVVSLLLQSHACGLSDNARGYDSDAQSKLFLTCHGLLRLPV